MVPLLDSMKLSPFQPLLHPRYYALHTELVQTQEITGQNLRLNLQNLANLRNLINVNRENRPVDPEPNEPEGQNRAQGQGNFFERGGFFVFKLLQIVILWQLVQFVLTNISVEHIFIIIFIVLAYFAIDHFQKRRGNQPVNPNPQEQQQQEAPRQEQPEDSKTKEDGKEEEHWEDVEDNE
jgi:hypothetical protein